MLTNSINMGLPDCRIAVVPACEADVDPAQSALFYALNGAPFQMRLRDTMDFAADFTAWLAANGSPLIATAVWAVAANSPKTPVIASQSFSPNGMCNFVLRAGVSPLPGDTYYLEVTVTTAATVAAGPNTVAIGARTLIRRINVVLVNG
jgi:hypothetical protein